LGSFLLGRVRFDYFEKNIENRLFPMLGVGLLASRHMASRGSSSRDSKYFFVVALSVVTIGVWLPTSCRKASRGSSVFDSTSYVGVVTIGFATLVVCQQPSGR
jgi:hypothetical protein